MRRETRETAGSRIFVKYTGKRMSKNEGINRGSSRVENEVGTGETAGSRMREEQGKQERQEWGLGRGAFN